MTPLESALIVLGFISVINAQTITTPPQDASATVGNNLTLTCGVSTTYTGGMEWRRFDATSAGGYRICDVFPPDPASCDAPEMYYLDSVTYSLTITSLVLTSGPEYGCKLIVGGASAVASVLVAAAPTITVPAIVETDKNASFSCNAEFSSKPYDELQANQQPTLTLSFGGSVVAQTQAYTNADGSQSHIMELTYDRLITIDDNGSEMLCTISTVTSSYSETSSVIVDVRHAVTVVGLDEAEVKSYYTVDENVTCTANGLPEPTYTWVDLNDTSHTISSQVLTFDTFTQGQEYFMVCRAENTYNSMDSQILGPFTVGVDPNGPGQVNQAGSNAWIAAAVLVPIAVIVAVVLIVIFLLRRKQKPPPVKTQSTLQARPPTTSANNNGPIVYSNPAGNQPPPLYSYQGPYTGGQTPRAGRDSPGYGDLGARQFGGMVGMTPQPQGQQQPHNKSNSFNEGGSIRSNSYAPVTSASSPPLAGVSNPAANVSRASSTSSHNQNNDFRYQPTPYQPTPYQPTNASYSRPSPGSQPRGAVAHSLDDSLV